MKYKKSLLIVVHQQASLSIIKISTTIYFVIPVQDEDAYRPDLDSIRNQSFKGDIHVYICVNQPDSWWYREDKRICERNRDLMDALRHMYQQDHRSR